MIEDPHREFIPPIPDCCRKQGQRYPLIAVLLIAIMNIMSGCCRYREIAASTKANRKELLIFLHLAKRKRLPSHITFREALKGRQFEAVLTAFNAWAEQYVTIRRCRSMAKRWRRR